MNETSKWVLSQIQGLGYDIDESQLQASIDSGDTEWFYNTLSGEGWDLGTKDDFKNSLSSSPIVRKDTSTSDVMGALRHAHDVDITKGQAGIDKKKKEDEEREAIRQQKINIGLTEQDKSDMEELASLKKRASSPAQFDETGIFITQEPVYNQYGMPTNVTKPVNTTLEEQIKEKEASMPSYTTRGENSSLDIDANAIERALTTDEGRNLRDTIYNKYAQEFKSSVVYQDLVDEFKKGTITEQDINNTFSELYSQKINNDFYEEIAKKGGLMHEYIKDAETRLNTKLAGEGAFNLQKRIDNARELSIGEAYDKFYERYKDWYGVSYEEDPLRGLHATALMKTIGTPTYSAEIKYAEQFNKDAINLVNAVNNDEGFVSAMGNTLGDIDTYDMGINEIMRTVGIGSIIKKVEDDEALTENEELLLDAALNYFTVSAYYSNKLGHLYKAGQTTAASLPFIAQFVLSSGSLSAFEGAVKGATSAGGKKLVAALWKHGQKKLAHFLNKEGVKAIGKATQGLALAGVEGAVMTATWGLPKIEAGAQSRMLGQVQTDFNYSTNELEYKGRTNRQSPEEAYKNAAIDTYVEYVSEMVLNKAFEPIGAWVRGTDTFGKIQRNNVVGTIVDIWDNPTWKSIRQTTQFGNLPEEVVEEEIGGLLRWGLASDVNSAEDAGLNLDAQIDIVLGLAPTSLVFGGVGTVSHYGSLWKGKREFRASLGSEEQKELFDKLMKESRSGQFGDLAHDLIREIVMDKNKPIEQKKKDIATIVSDYQQLLSKEAQKLSQEVTEKENTKNAEELTASLQNETDKHIYLTRDKKGRLLAIKGGDVVLTKDEEGNTIIDQKKTSPQLRVSYLSDNGNISEKELDMNASELSAQVAEYKSEWFKGFKASQATAVADKKNEFEYEGIVYNTQSGRYVGTKEEVDKRNKEEEEKDKLEEPKVDTKPHTISRTFELDVDGKKEFVTFFGSRVEQNEDGSIKNAGTTSIKLGGRILRNEGKQAIIDLISDKLKAEHAQAVEEYRKKTATAEEVSGTEGAVAHVELEPLLSDEERAAKALEDAKAEVRNNLPEDKNGELLFDKFTPEQLFIYESYTEGQDVALKTITDELSYLYTQLSKVYKKDVSPQQKKKEKLKIENDIKKNENVIIKYFGQETLDKITAARAEALQLNTPPVQEGAPAVAPAQGETTPPAEPTIAPEQETPQGELPAEPDTTPLPPAEDTEEIDVKEKEPMNLLDGQYAIVSSNSTRGKEQIVKVTQNEDGTETWTSIHDDSTVSQKAYKKQQFPEQDNMRVLGIKEGNEITPVIVLSGLADLSQAKGELKVVPVNTKDGKVHEVHVSLLYKPEADGGWALLKGVGSRVLSPVEAAKYDSLDALLDFPIIPNVTVGNFTLRDMLEYPTLARLKARLDQLGIEYDKQTINTNLETALARWRELVRENNLNEEFKNNLDKLSPSTLATYKLYRAGVEPFKAGVPVADTMRTRSNINLYVQLDSIGMLPNNISNPLAQLSVLAEVASDLGIIQKKAKGKYTDAIASILAKTQKEVEANTEEFTKPKEAVEDKATKNKQPEQPKVETPKQQKPKAETKEEAPAPAKRKTNIDSLRDAFVEAYVRTQNQAYNAMQKTMAKTAFKGMIDKMSEEDAIALFLNLGLEAAKSQGKMKEDMVNAAQALLDSKHGAAINAIIGGPQQETNQEPVETAEETTVETEQTPEDAIDYEALVAERNELQETIYDMEDDEAANANARIAQINEILRNRPEFMVGDVVVEHAESTKRIIEILKAAGIRVVTFKNEDLPKYANKKKLEELSDGQIVYGFASNDTIYLNEDHFNPNSPLHEFTHLWVTAYKQAFPNEWKRFVEIANKSALAANLRKPLKDGKASPYAKLSADEMASEVLSRYTGYLYGELDAEGRTAFENMMQAQTMEEKLAEKSLLNRIRNIWKKIISWFDKSIENEKKEETIDDMIRRFAQAPMETLARGREAVDKLMLNNTSENLDNSKKSSTFAENNENYERTDEFRELQERSLGLSQSRISEFRSGGQTLSDEDRRRVGGVFQRLMESERNGGRNGQWINLIGKGNQFKIAQVNPAIFHDIFQICRNYLPNGELVDLHDNYADCKCFISEDGLCGFAIEPNGNLISVFSLNPSDKKGFLYAIKDLIRQEGATHLDCFVSNKQPLAEIYQKALGFHVASEMDYNMEYDHDNIAENHGMPKIAFMVDKPTEKREFDKDSYDDAYEYQQSQTSTAEREQIIAEAKANGTFMLAPNGKPTNLTEDMWVSVRTQAFKDWFGDWQNDPANASKVLDENGEPLVVYHGSKMAGFDEFQQLDESVNGFFTTDNKAGANTYATNREERRNNVMADEAQLNAEPHHGIYSLFANIKNPAVYDFAGKMYNEYGEPLGYYVEMSGEEWDTQPVPKFATEEEALAFARENGEPDSAVKTTYLSTDDLVEMAKAAGHDGVIFKNVLDGAEHNEEQPVMNDYIAFEPNQLKSATQNIGTFNPEDNRIEFMIGTTPSGGPVNPMDIDSELAAKIAVKTQQLFAVIADPKVDMPKEFGWIRRQIIDTLDRTEGIRWLMESIKKYRKENGLPPMGEGFDVRTMVEAMDSKIMNQTRLYIETKENKLRDEVEKLAKKLNKSPLYKKYKLQNVKTDKGEDIELSTVQMIERYMIARDSYEREKIKGNARALGDFYRYMGVDVVTFMKEFEEEMFSSVKEFNAFWNAVRGCTDIVIDKGFEAGLISLEDYETYKKREYYVPERDFAEVEDNEELAVDSHFHRSGRSNKLEGIREAKGGGPLAANILANIGLLGRDAIIKANKNIVKKAMYDLLRANEDWCRKFHVPVPHQVWYKKNADGSVERMTDAPTAEERELQNRIKAQIESIEEEIKQTRLLADSAATPEVKAKYENEIDEFNEQISMLRDMMPFLDEFDTRNLIYATRAAQNESTVIVYVDGVAQEMLFPTMSSIAMALNGTYKTEGEWKWFKDKIANIFSAGLTVYNPAFFAVNVARDVPFIATKGFAEYGMTFPIRFAIQLASKFFCRDIWRVVWNGDYASAKNEHVKEFFEGGANTGYTAIPDIKKLKNATKNWGKGTTVTWSNLGDIISYMNTFSEVWTRAAAYSVVRNMGNNKEEGIRAAKNLSVNLNRKGLGNKFMDVFGSISIFMNAAIQGASGWYRAFKGDEETFAGKTWHATKAAMGFIFAPAFAGFIDTMLNPDDDDEMLYYSDYDRDNYVLFGDFRIPLNEQIKPFWCIGVNIALGMQGRRNREQRINSLMSSTFTNLFPLPPVINSSIVMAINGVTGQKDYNIFQIMENLITPQALGGVHDLSDGVNFMGTQLSWDSGDIPQYMLGENEEAWSRELAHLAYIIGGGNKYLPSITRDNGKKILFDFNPKQISAVRQTFVPSTFRDMTDFFTGVFTGDLGSPEDYATIRRFYKPRDKEMGMYLIVSDAKQLVKRNEDIVSNMKKQLAGGKITNDRRKVEEANKRLEAAMSEKEIKEIKAYIQAYELMSIRERAKDYGMTEKAFRDALSKEQLKVYKKYNETPREEMARKILILTREYNDIEVEDMTLGEVIGL